MDVQIDFRSIDRTEALEPRIRAETSRLGDVLPDRKSVV